MHATVRITTKEQCEKMAPTSGHEVRTAAQHVHAPAVVALPTASPTR